MDLGSSLSTNGLWHCCSWMLPHRKLDHCIIQGKNILVMHVTKKNLPKNIPQRAVKDMQCLSVPHLFFSWSWENEHSCRYERNPVWLGMCQSKTSLCPANIILQHCQAKNIYNGDKESLRSQFNLYEDVTYYINKLISSPF